MKRNFFILVLFAAFFAPQITKAQFNVFNTNYIGTNAIFDGLGVGDFNGHGATVTNARLHVNNFYFNSPGGALNGLLFRTDGADNVDNLWQMFTGTGNGVTEKGRIFTTVNWTYPSLNTDFNIKATQGSLFLYSVDASNNNYHVMIDSKYVVIETTPKVKPEVANGDIAVTAIGLGIMLNVPNGNNYYRITVDNTSKLNNEFIAKL